MPKATVHKNHYMKLGENKIRPTKDLSFSSPTGNGVLLEDFGKTLFGCPISMTFHTRHDLGALFSTEDIGHGYIARLVQLKCVRHLRRCAL